MTPSTTEDKHYIDYVKGKPNLGYIRPVTASFWPKFVFTLKIW